MTAIVAFKFDDKVYLAGDRQASNSWEHYLVNAPKIFKAADDLYMGYTSSFYMGQILEHSFVMPAKWPEMSDDKFLYTQLVPKLRELFEANDFGRKKDDKMLEPNLGQFILIYKKRIFIFQGNASLLDVEEAGVGCGGTDVLTSIMTGISVAADHLDIDLDDKDVKKIIGYAYNNCSAKICGVSAEHDIFVIGDNDD